ncbi:uncharacterized protein zgc:158260 [Cyclopterus lumpus]|uniref:uncharacterized protein zgc:158260 n=1 Tax=Cyclopterus lumpus TaxID=8103 RepID=UPI0014866101|nr:uncharacterized protein zgc:158260 [Cyclopterus lumpus]
MERENARPVFPWYKERLQTKYLKAPANRNSSVGTCSRFASVSLDDFSDCSSVFSGDRGGVSPVIFHDAPKHNATNSGQKPRKCTSKEHACFSKQMIRKQMRREHVAAVEKELKQHPLAMFPHYKDHMTPELFDEVVSILDPDMSVSGASGLPTAPGDHAEEENEENHTEPTATVTRDPRILHKNGDGIKKGRTVKGNPLKGNPLKGNPLKGNPLKGNPLKGNPLKGNPLKGNPLKGNPLGTHRDMKVPAKPSGRRFSFPDKKTNVSEYAIIGVQDTSSPSFPTEVEEVKTSSGQE